MACSTSNLAAEITVTDYTLMSSTGNMIDSFDDEAAARAALQRIVALEPESADEIALFISDDAGRGHRGTDPRRPRRR